MSTERPYAPPDNPDDEVIDLDDAPEGELDFNDRGRRDLYDERDPDDDFFEEDFDDDMGDGDMTFEEALDSI
jgi:hypothetical protein